MMLVVIFFSNLFWGRLAIEGRIYNDLSGVVGDDAAHQIQEIIKNAAVTGNNFVAILSFVMLIIAATSVFTEMQVSMNMIWNLKVKPNRGVMQMLKNKLISFLIVTGLGLLLLFSLIINSLLEGFVGRMQEMFPETTVIIIYIAQMLVTLVVVALLFAFIYKELPDAFIKWKYVLPGALFTSVLFLFGKYCISLYLNTSNVSSSYGAAGSLVILMLWVYYSSAILYFGAVFTKAYALKYGPEVKPKPYASIIRVVQLESSALTIQENERTL
jgi:membrane protein